MRREAANLEPVHALIRERRFEAARQALLRLVRNAPGNPDVCTMLCFVSSRLGEPVQALYYAERAAAVSPGDANILHNFGKSLALNGRHEEAVGVLERALALHPQNLNARIEIASSLDALHRFDEVLAHCREGLAFYPGHAGLRSTLAVTLLNVGRAAEAVAELEAGVRDHPDDHMLATSLAATGAYAWDAAGARLLQRAVAYESLLRRLMGPPLPLREAPEDPERPLRVGVISPDLRAHAVGFFFEPILERWKGSGMDLRVYSTATQEDAVSARLRRHAPAWKHAPFMPEAELAAMIRADRIDVLIELSGHTRAHRLPVLHLRPAPVQITYLGYPGTTGLSAVEHRFVDSLTDPPGMTEAFGVERLVRLDPCFLCFRAPREAPAVVERSGGPIVFGSFNAMAKVSDPLMRLWSRVLERVPGSRLVVKNSAMKSAAVRSEIGERFARAGVSTERLTLLEPTPGVPAHLAAYGEIDIGLDTYPYHGTTTTCEALWMGVPVVTLEGTMHASRVGVSLLTNVGLSDLIAKSEDEYVAIAAGLAERDRLAPLRAGLRARVGASALCDEEAFASRFFGAIRMVWREHAERTRR